MVKRIAVVLADDHEALRDRVSEMLRGEFDVVGRAADGLAALEVATRVEPDILLMDISMPRLDGIEVARRLRAQGSDVRVVFVTVHEEPAFAREATDAGAYGYVVKSHLDTELFPAIHEALAGRRFISPLVAV